MNFFSASSSPIRIYTETDERLQARCPDAEPSSPPSEASSFATGAKTPPPSERKNFRRHSVGNHGRHAIHGNRLFDIAALGFQQDDRCSMSNTPTNTKPGKQMNPQNFHVGVSPSAPISPDNHLHQQHQQYPSASWPQQRPQGPWKVPLSHPKRIRSYSLGPTNGTLSVKFDVREDHHQNGNEETAADEKTQPCPTKNKGPLQSNSLPSFSKFPPLAKSSIFRSKSFASRNNSVNSNSQNRNTPFSGSVPSSSNDSAPNSPRIIQRSGSKSVKQDLNSLEQLLNEENVESLLPSLDKLNRLVKVSSDAFYQVVMRKCRGEHIFTQLLLRFPELEEPCQVLLKAISKPCPTEPKLDLQHTEKSDAKNASSTIDEAIK